MSKENLVEKAMLEMQKIEELIAENAKGILSSTMKDEINALVKESLMSEQVDDEDIETPEMDEPEMEDSELETDMDMEPDVDMGDEMDIEDEMEDETEDVLDLTDMDDESLLTVFKAMSEDDGIIVSKDASDIHLKDENSDVEYLIKLKESIIKETTKNKRRLVEGLSEKGIKKIAEMCEKHGTRETAKKLIDICLANKVGLTSSDLSDSATFANGLDEIEDMLSTEDYAAAFDYAKDVATEMLADEGYDEDMFEEAYEMDEEDMDPRSEDEQSGYNAMFGDEGDEDEEGEEDFEIEDDDDETIYEIEMDEEEDEMDESYDMDEEEDEDDEEEEDEMDESYDMEEAMDEMDMDEMDMDEAINEILKKGLSESKMKPKGVGMGKPSKFKFKPKPNQDKGFDEKMKEGPKTKGTGKPKFEYKDGKNTDGKMKKVHPKGEKKETKEAAKTYGFGSKEGRGLRKGVTPNRNKVYEAEILDLREKNEEYRKALNLFREKINEVAVFNSNLAYATRLFTEHSTTKKEKINILRRFDDVQSLKESKTLYNSIKKELNESEGKQITESIAPKINNTASTGSAVNLIESTTYENPQFLRMKDLMNKLTKK